MENVPAVHITLTKDNIEYDMAIKYSKIYFSQRHLYHKSTKIESKITKQSLRTQYRGHISQIFVLSTMQFYPKFLPRFTHAIIGKRWVKLGKTFYSPNPEPDGEICCSEKTRLKHVVRPESVSFQKPIRILLYAIKNRRMVFSYAVETFECEKGSCVQRRNSDTKNMQTLHLKRAIPTPH